MSVIERMFLPSAIRRGRLATSPAWDVVLGDGSGERWRFQRKKDAVRFVAGGSRCENHERFLCRNCNGRRIAGENRSKLPAAAGDES